MCRFFVADSFSCSSFSLLHRSYSNKFQQTGKKPKSWAFQTISWCPEHDFTRSGHGAAAHPAANIIWEPSDFTWRLSDPTFFHPQYIVYKEQITLWAVMSGWGTSRQYSYVLASFINARKLVPVQKVFQCFWWHMNWSCPPPCICNLLSNCPNCWVLHNVF